MAAARWVGRGDKNGADGAAVDAMRTVLSTVPMTGIVVIGEGEKDEAKKDEAKKDEETKDEEKKDEKKDEGTGKMSCLSAVEMQLKIQVWFDMCTSSL